MKQGCFYSCTAKAQRGEELLLDHTATPVDCPALQTLLRGPLTHGFSSLLGGRVTSLLGQAFLLPHLGFPKMIRTRETLAEYLTVIIFTTSAQHAAVNFGQVGTCGRTVLLPGLGGTSTRAASEKHFLVAVQNFIAFLSGQNNCRAIYKSLWSLWKLKQFGRWERHFKSYICTNDQIWSSNLYILVLLILLWE